MLSESPNSEYANGVDTDRAIAREMYQFTKKLALTFNIEGKIFDSDALESDEGVSDGMRCSSRGPVLLILEKFEVLTKPALVTVKYSQFDIYRDAIFHKFVKYSLCLSDISIVPILQGLNIHLILSSTISISSKENKIRKYSLYMYNISTILAQYPVLSDSIMFYYSDMEIQSMFKNDAITFETCSVLLQLLQLFSQVRPGGRPSTYLSNIVVKILFYILKRCPIGTSNHLKLLSHNKRVIKNVDDIAHRIADRFRLDNDLNSCEHEMLNRKRKLGQSEILCTVESMEEGNVAPESFNRDSSSFPKRNSRDKFYLKSRHIDLLGIEYNELLSSELSFNQLDKIFLIIHDFALSINMLPSFIVTSSSHRLFEATVKLCSDWKDGYSKYVSSNRKSFSLPSWVMIESNSFFNNSSYNLKNISSVGGPKWIVLKCLMLVLGQGLSVRISAMIEYFLNDIKSIVNDIILCSELKTPTDVNIIALQIENLIKLTMAIEVVISFLSHSRLVSTFTIKSSICQLCESVINIVNNSRIFDAAHVIASGIAYLLCHLSSATLQEITECSECYESVSSIFEWDGSLCGIHPILSALFVIVVLPRFGVQYEIETLKQISSRLSVIQRQINLTTENVTKHCCDFISLDLTSISFKVSPSIYTLLKDSLIQWPHVENTNKLVENLLNIHTLPIEKVCNFVSVIINNHVQENSFVSDTTDHPNVIPLDQLPVDVLVNTFLPFLSAKRLCRLASTNKYFHSLIFQNQQLWKTVFISKFAECFKNVRYSSDMASISNWRQLVISRSALVEKSKFMSIINGYKPRVCPYCKCRVIFRNQTAEKKHLELHLSKELKKKV